MPSSVKMRWVVSEIWPSAHATRPVCLMTRLSWHACASRLLGNCIVLQDTATLSLIIIVWCNYWFTGIISVFVMLEKDLFVLLRWRKFRNKGLPYLNAYTNKGCVTREKCDKCIKTLSETHFRTERAWSLETCWSDIIEYSSGVGEFGLEIYLAYDGRYLKDSERSNQLRKEFSSAELLVVFREMRCVTFGRDCCYCWE